MGRRYVLLDDYDGKELPDDTAPVSLSLGRTTYNLFLSEANHGKLLEALEPFIKDAEKAGTQQRSTSPAKSTDKDKLKAVREWAQSTGYKYTNAKGEETTLGDRGRIPQEVVDAYDAAN
jgi:hypothetical protein